MDIISSRCSSNYLKTHTPLKTLPAHHTTFPESPIRFISRWSIFTSSIEIQKNKGSDHKNNFRVIRLSKASFRLYYSPHHVQRTPSFHIAQTWYNLLMMHIKRICKLGFVHIWKSRVVSITNLTILKKNLWNFWVSCNT